MKKSINKSDAATLEGALMPEDQETKIGAKSKRIPGYRLYKLLGVSDAVLEDASRRYAAGVLTNIKFIFKTSMRSFYNSSAIGKLGFIGKVIFLPKYFGAKLITTAFVTAKHKIMETGDGITLSGLKADPIFKKNFSIVQNANDITPYYCVSPMIIKGIPHGLVPPFVISLFSSQTQNLQVIFVSANPNALKYIHIPFKTTIEKAISIDPYAIKHVKTPTLEIQKSALEAFGNSHFLLLSVLKNPHPEILEAAIQETPQCIKFVPNPSLELQNTAIMLDPHVIKYIANPSNELQSLALKKSFFAISNDISEEQKLVLFKNAGYLHYDSKDLTPLDIPDSAQLIIREIVDDQAASDARAVYTKIKFKLNDEDKSKLLNGDRVQVDGDVRMCGGYINIETNGFLQYVQYNADSEGVYINKAFCKFLPKDNADLENKDTLQKTDRVQYYPSHFLK